MNNPEELITLGTQDTRQRQTKQNTNNVNKTCALLQTTGSKDEPNIVYMRFQIATDITTRK
jgi:hypothetical protein